MAASLTLAMLNDPTVDPEFLWDVAWNDGLDETVRAAALCNPNFPLARLARTWHEGTATRHLLEQAFGVRAVLQNPSFFLFAMVDGASAHAIIDSHLSTTLMEALDQSLPGLVRPTAPLKASFRDALVACLQKHGIDDASSLARALIGTYRTTLASISSPDLVKNDADISDDEEFDLRFGVVSVLQGLDDGLRWCPKPTHERFALFVEVFRMLLVELGLPTDEHPPLVLLTPPW